MNGLIKMYQQTERNNPALFLKKNHVVVKNVFLKCSHCYDIKVHNVVKLGGVTWGLSLSRVVMALEKARF